eukprot:scaffold39580_cov244-Amphora_coffeaeformis.AAC.5
MENTQARPVERYSKATPDSVNQRDRVPLLPLLPSSKYCIVDGAFVVHSSVCYVALHVGIDAI